jgi:pSer/pThr/pTyr-binding forkhead associated (FHA) protein
MELKLIVLAGAKQGLEIPLKKDKFLIGRSTECALRAGSEAISRRHCAIVRANGKWTVRDLGSRNGTYVNDQRITEQVPLSVGDDLRVGPLHFRVGANVSAAAKNEPSPTAAAPPKPVKQPPVKDVADIAQRTAGKADSSATEDDVSRWLLGLADPAIETTLKETRTIRLEETTLNRVVPPQGAPEGEDVLGEDEAAESETEISEENGTRTDDPEKSGGWNLFKRGKSAPGKKKPGKLPPRPEAQSKDSREAAADILREMTRRR